MCLFAAHDAILSFSYYIFQLIHPNLLFYLILPCILTRVLYSLQECPQAITKDF